MPFTIHRPNKIAPANSGRGFWFGIISRIDQSKSFKLITSRRFWFWVFLFASVAAVCAVNFNAIDESMQPAIIVTALTGGLAGAVAASWFTVWRDQCTRRRIFSAEMEVVKLRIDDPRVGDPTTVYLTERNMVRDECAKIRADIPSHRYSKFFTARDRFLRFEEEQHQRAMRSLVNTNYPGALTPSPQDTRSGKKRLLDALDILIDCAK